MPASVLNTDWLSTNSFEWFPSQFGMASVGAFFACKWYRLTNRRNSTLTDDYAIGVVGQRCPLGAEKDQRLL